MKADILLGLQWGDEGKGKIVDVLTPSYDVIARFQGGPNAGHSLEFNNIKHVLHTIPSGIFHPDAINIIGNGVVLDPVIFKKEIEAIKKLGINPIDNLLISNKAHLILPTHRQLDAAYEHAKGTGKIGSTLKGIGPAYTDKVARNGLRTGDILSNLFYDKYAFYKAKHLDILKHLNYIQDFSDYEREWIEGVELLKQFKFISCSYVVNRYLNENKKILAEGAQGTMLDIDFGTYPFVTSSNTVSAGACTGLGISPNHMGEIIGIFKAYCTRVGSGPFPSEQLNDIGDLIRKFGNEYGSTTGRPRRCGWLDIPALKYSIMINGITQMIITKADVLNTFDKIKVCTSYIVNGVETEEVPYDLSLATPVYTEFDGWKEELTNIRTFSELPKKLKDYIQYIESTVNVPITIVSTGPDRLDTIFLR